ncbi:hypothetical protein L5515_010502 [Caenorhabditis briggsae]|uniref:Serpentine receptor class r-10 n=1 Tax=Caenorhabditis briggsae TaxID=6238 RepID=A0AAE9ERG5_CAEBR|nr:hypothetical protein L5515_010502 [Caenorhabditis briggsae]
MLFGKIKYSIQLISFLVSLVCNFVLIFLILNKSPKKMGSYKYLLVYFCCFSIFFSILDIIVEPYIHSHGSAMFMMMELRHLKFAPKFAYLLTTLLCGCFAISITTISIQFVFRYFAMERKGRISYFRGKWLIIWFLVPSITGAVWIIQDWIFLVPNDKMSEYISDTVFSNYDINVTDITYVGCLFYPPDENGIPQLDYKQLIGFFLFGFILSTTFWTVVIFGVKSYKLVRALPQHGESEYTYKLQSQLFKALVAQAFIPITFLFIPIGLLFTAPLIHLDFEPASFLVTIFYSMYPAVDPLPIMLIVADYREGLSDLLQNLRGKRTNQIGFSYTDQQVTSIS